MAKRKWLTHTYKWKGSAKKKKLTMPSGGKVVSRISLRSRARKKA